MAIVIEFVGAAGCGKSHITDRLVEKLGTRCIASKNVKISWLQILGYIARNINYTVQTCRFILQCRQKSYLNFRDSFTSVLIYQARVNIANRTGIPIIVFDEGILHKFRQIRNRSKISDLLYRSVDEEMRKLIFSIPDLVVLVKCTAETVAKRRIQSGKVAYREKDYRHYVTEMNDSFYKATLHTDDDITSAKKELGFRSLIIDNDTHSSISDHIDHIINAAMTLNRR
jgi:deoxyadenosine/deoxycytidine kinase